MALHARAFTRVAFDPFITRGEDLDYLFNMRMFGYDVWFDNEWTVRHLPPESEKRSPRFMQDVYRWYYERAKLTFAAHQKELIPVTAASLMPYPGPWISRELDDRVRKTAMVRSVFTREHEATCAFGAMVSARQRPMRAKTLQATCVSRAFGPRSWTGFGVTHN